MIFLLRKRVIIFFNLFQKWIRVDIKYVCDNTKEFFNNRHLKNSQMGLKTDRTVLLNKLLFLGSLYNIFLKCHL